MSPGKSCHKGFFPTSLLGTEKQAVEAYIIQQEYYTQQQSTVALMLQTRVCYPTSQLWSWSKLFSEKIQPIHKAWEKMFCHLWLNLQQDLKQNFRCSKSLHVRRHLVLVWSLGTKNLAKMQHILKWLWDTKGSIRSSTRWSVMLIQADFATY